MYNVHSLLNFLQILWAPNTVRWSALIQLCHKTLSAVMHTTAPTIVKCKLKKICVFIGRAVDCRVSNDAELAGC